jgi:hypothetical protein
MYTMLGADGKEYGPATADQVRQWIAEGRANARTQVLPAGQTEWKRLADLPEFAEALASQVSKTPPPPVGPPRSESEEILARDYTVDIGRCLGRGWGLVMRHFGLAVGASAVVFVLVIAVSFIPIASTLLLFVVCGGLDLLFLKLARGQPAGFGDVFAGFTLAFVPLMLVSVITGVLMPVGLLFCLLPGIYLMVVWMMFPPLLILDKKMDFWPAMELSRKMVHKHFWQVFGLWLVTLVLFLLGGLLLCVGVFIAMPVTTAAIVYAYEDIFGPRPGPSALQTEAPVQIR